MASQPTHPLRYPLQRGSRTGEPQPSRADRRHLARSNRKRRVVRHPHPLRWPRQDCPRSHRSRRRQSQMGRRPTGRGPRLHPSRFNQATGDHGMSTEYVDPTTDTTPEPEAPQLGPRHFDPKDMRDPVFPGGRWLPAKIARMEFGKNADNAKFGAGAENCLIHYQVFIPEDPDIDSKLFRPFAMTTEYTTGGPPFAWMKWCEAVGINVNAPFTVDPMDWIGRDVEIKLEVTQTGEGLNRRKVNRLNEIRLPL